LKFNELLFGTAGIPIACEGTTLDGLHSVRSLGLDAMELQFVRSINISDEKAPEVKKIAQQNNVALTTHGQYFVNLNAVEKEKLEASKKRILNAAIRANDCGAFSLTFHAGFYLKQEPSKVYDKICKNLKLVVKSVQNESNSIWIRPETTGKATQFGNLKELLKLSQDVEQVMPCMDFAHLHARNQTNNTLHEFEQNLIEVEDALGKEGLDQMHIHMSGINYTEKGERNHLELENSDMNYRDLMKILKKFKVKGVLISESPNLEKDALLMKKTYEGLSK
jgi:deoxyribonuclease IV